MSATAYPQVSVLQLRAELAVNPITKPLLVGHIGTVVAEYEARTNYRVDPGVPAAGWVHVPVSKLRPTHVESFARTITPEELAERERGYRGAAKAYRGPRWVGEDCSGIPIEPRLETRRFSRYVPLERTEVAGGMYEWRADPGKYDRLACVLAEWRRALGRHHHAVGPEARDPTTLLLVAKHEPGPEMMATIRRLWSTARPEGVTALRIEWTQV